MTESDVQAQGMRYLRLLGAVVVRVNSGAMKAEGRYVKFNDNPGCADVIVCLGGRFVAVDFKHPDAAYKKAERRPWGEPIGADEFPLSAKRLRLEKQREFLHAVVKAGGIGLFARSVEELKAALEEGGII